MTFTCAGALFGIRRLGAVLCVEPCLLTVVLMALQLLFSSCLQTCPSLACTRATMISSWWCAAIVDRWWNRRHLKSTASGDTDHWPSCTLGYGRPPLPPSRSSVPPAATLHHTGPTPLLFCPGKVASKEWGSPGPHLHLPCRLSIDTPRIPRMESGKETLFKGFFSHVPVVKINVYLFTQTFSTGEICPLGCLVV